MGRMGDAPSVADGATDTPSRPLRGQRLRGDEAVVVVAGRRGRDGVGAPSGPPLATHRQGAWAERMRWMDTRYPALKVVSALLKGLGYVAVFVGVIALCYSLVGLSQYQGHGSTTDQIGSALMGGAGLMLSLLLILAGVVTIAFGELITVIVDIEANTRRGTAHVELTSEGQKTPTVAAPASASTAEEPDASRSAASSSCGENREPVGDETGLDLLPRPLRRVLRPFIDPGSREEHTSPRDE